MVVQEWGCVGAALGASAWFTSETEVTVVCRSRLGVGGGVGGLAVLVWLESEVRPSECGSAAMPVCFGVGVGVGGFAVRWVGRCRTTSLSAINCFERAVFGAMVAGAVAAGVFAPEKLLFVGSV